MWLRNANWEWFTFLHLSRLLLLQKDQKKGLRQEVPFRRMETPMVPSWCMWVLKSNDLEIICGIVLDRKVMTSYLLLLITGHKGFGWSAWGAWQISRGKPRELILFIIVEPMYSLCCLWLRKLLLFTHLHMHITNAFPCKDHILLCSFYFSRFTSHFSFMFNCCFDCHSNLCVL